MEYINTEKVRQMAKIAMLDLKEEEVEWITEMIQGILGHFQSIKNMDLDDGESFFEGGKSVLRKDEVIKFEDREGLFRNTKDVQEGGISIPKVLD